VFVTFISYSELLNVLLNFFLLCF